jgi:hypothetical protein
MSSMKYVDVSITRQTSTTAQRGFGVALILGTSKVQAYKEYTDAATISTDYGSGSKEAKIATALFSGTPKVDKVVSLGILYNGATGNPADLTAALNTLVLTHNDWYYLITPEQGDDEINALGAWAQANDKLYFVETTNQTLIHSGMNTAVLVTDRAATEFQAAAWVGVGAPLEVGSFTWTFKQLPGMTPAAYDSAAVDAIHARNFNTFIKQSGVNITSNSKTAGGEWIDIIQSIHALESRISDAIFNLQVTMPKIPFTDAGIALVASQVTDVLQDAFNAGMIADEDGKPLYTVTVPSRASISAEDRAARNLPGIPFTATLSGAVEKVEISGVVTV